MADKNKEWKKQDKIRDKFVSDSADLLEKLQERITYLETFPEPEDKISQYGRDELMPSDPIREAIKTFVSDVRAICPEVIQ